MYHSRATKGLRRFPKCPHLCKFCWNDTTFHPSCLWTRDSIRRAGVVGEAFIISQSFRSQLTDLLPRCCVMFVCACLAGPNDSAVGAGPGRKSNHTGRWIFQQRQDFRQSLAGLACCWTIAYSTRSGFCLGVWDSSGLGTALLSCQTVAGLGFAGGGLVSERCFWRTFSAVKGIYEGGFEKISSQDWCSAIRVTMLWKYSQIKTMNAFSLFINTISNRHWIPQR